MQHWTEIKERASGFLRLRFMLLVYRVCGRKILQIWLYPIVFFVVVFNKKLRDASRQYFQQIYLTKGKDNFKKPNTLTIFKHVFCFADSLADKVESWSGNIPIDKLKFHTPEVYAKLVKNLDANQGVLLIGSHLGNMELFRAIGNLQADKIAKKEVKINAIVQSNYTAKFNKLLNFINKNSEVNLISATDIDVEQTIILSDKLQNGEILVISGDRTAQNNQNYNIPIKFLGEEAEFPIGPITLANIMKVPTYIFFCLKSQEDSQFYDVYFYEVDLKLNSSRKEQKENTPFLIQSYAQRLEKLCLQYPYQWFNFFKFWPEKQD